MKLKEYIKSLNKMVKENPELNNFDVIYSVDDKGSTYKEVYCTPSVGVFYYNGEFFMDDDILDNEIENAICIN